MKISWGNRILAVILVFIAGMGYLVYRSVNTNYDLVSQEYYKDELDYQKVIDGTNRAATLSNPASLATTDSGILLRLPQEMKGKTVNGTVFFYCATDVRKDRKLKLAINQDAEQLIPAGGLAPGTYTVKISWESAQLNYYSELNYTR